MQSDQIKILEDWGEILVVFKPVGWLTVPGRGNHESTPVLSHVLGEQLRNGRQKSDKDLFVIHRLDQGTSGVILFARSQAAHRALSLLFESRNVLKTYLCLVKGTPIDQTIKVPIFKLLSKKIKSVVSEKGKKAQTIINTISSHDGISLVQATPLTGRSHQIRVHLAHVGSPLLGDPLYGGPEDYKGIPLPYPLLHASEIAFEWPMGTKRHAIAKPIGNFLEISKGLSNGLFDR